MASFWNEFELKKPPLITVHVPDSGFAKEVFVAINRYLQQLSEPDAKSFDETAALIARLMARRKSSFRCMIGFRAVCKLNSALCRLLRLDLPRELKLFRGALPDVCDAELAGDLPTGSSFDYILVRMLGVYHLHERIRDCCLAAASYFTQMLRNNFFMEYITLLLAAIAKINKLSALLSNKCAKLYNLLIPQQSKFPRTNKSNFLSDDCEFPSHLPLIEIIQQEETRLPATMSKEPTVLTHIEKAKQRSKADIGTVIARTPIETKQKPFSLDALQTVEDVKRFIKVESKSRLETPESCVTKAILKHEWLAAQTIFQRKIQANEHQRALNIFRKFIGNKI